MPPWGGLFNTRKDNASERSISPTPNSNSKRDKRKEKQANSGHGMAHLRDYTSGDDPRMYRIRSTVDPRSNGHFIDMHGMGYGSRPEPEFVRSRLMNQFQTSLNATVTESIRKACLHWDDEVLNLENNYHALLEERNGLKNENKNLSNRVKSLEQDVNAKVALLREFQSGHLKTSGSRKLAPSSSAISDEYEALERSIKNTVFARVARLNIRDPVIEALLQHKPFLEAVKVIMVNEKEAEGAENLPRNLLEVVEDQEKNGLLRWMVQGVIHDILYKRIMRIQMPGLNLEELRVMEKIYNVIALSEEGQGLKSAQEWRAETYRRLAYWAENVGEIEKYQDVAPEVSEIGGVFGDLVLAAEVGIKEILEPFCDETPEGKNFTGFITDIVDRAFQFSILIGSQTSKYELHRDLEKTDDFKAVPEHLDDNSNTNNNSNASLFFAAPALVKTSGEDGESYDESELLVQGKIFVLFGFGDPIEEEELPDVPDKIPIKMASPVNGGEDEIGAIDDISKAEALQGGAKPFDEKETERKEVSADANPMSSGADTLPNESNPNMTESSDQPATNEANDATAMTTSNPSGIDIPKEILSTTSPSSPEAEGSHQETSTKTNQVALGAEHPEPQLQAIQKTLREPLEVSPSSEHQLPERESQSLEARLIEIPASPSLPKPPSIPEQPVLLPQAVPVAILEPQCPAPAPVETEAVLPVQARESTTLASHIASLVGAAEGEAPPPQPPVGTQLGPSPEPSIPSTSHKSEPILQSEPKQQLESQTKSQPSKSSSASSPTLQSTPRTLPVELINLSKSSDNSKDTMAVTIQSQEGHSVEIVS
ncbi:hypothetical protein TWF730_008772 [Orbilia blumenaviensis]|uniref:Uncharacterized protein n=1 Tax=Orbilia blumenaviensis TaxID=1796055 RepID=A0AAV9V4K1_9PEZI